MHLTEDEASSVITIQRICLNNTLCSGTYYLLIPMQERLQKIVAHAGVASRREAERLIVLGQVAVKLIPLGISLPLMGVLLPFPLKNSMLC